MCVLIDVRVKACNKRIGWKVLVLSRQGYLESIVYFSRNKQEWQPGVPFHMDEGPTRQSHDLRTYHGVYVYTSKTEAVKQCNRYRWGSYRWGDVVPVRVHLDPKDFLYMNIKGTVATYKKVTPCEEQPFINWK